MNKNRTRSISMKQSLNQLVARIDVAFAQAVLLLHFSKPYFRVLGSTVVNRCHDNVAVCDFVATAVHTDNGRDVQPSFASFVKPPATLRQVDALQLECRESLSLLVQKPGYAQDDKRDVTTLLPPEGPKLGRCFPRTFRKSGLFPLQEAEFYEYRLRTESQDKHGEPAESAAVAFK